MKPNNTEWEQKVSDLWASIDDHSEEAFLTRMEQLVAELPVGSAAAVFERASSLDSTGHSDLAVPLYRQALELGLHRERRRRAVIQLASSLRNLGRASESVDLLRAEREAESDDLDDAVTAFLALALVDTGHEREAVSIALTALSRHMTRYRRSLVNYARTISDHPSTLGNSVSASSANARDAKATLQSLPSSALSRASVDSSTLSVLSPSSTK